MGDRHTIPKVIVADSGPLLHLFWVDALVWALPPQEVTVVEPVWQEVTKYDAGALADDRLKRVALSSALSPLPLDRPLHTGEAAALSYAAAQPAAEGVLVLTDDTQARQACKTLMLPFIGSIGLITEAYRQRLVSKEIAEDALRSLPGQGRLYVKPSLIARVIAEMERN